MAETICTGADTKIPWRHLRRIAELIDELAATMATPAWSDITDDDAHPFVAASVIPVEFVQHFEITNRNGCPMVASRYLLDGFAGMGGQAVQMGTAPASVNYQFLADYAADNKLFFVHDQDDCWCNKIFKVIPEGGRYTLEKVGDTDPKYACCDSLFIPGVGHLLDYDQDIIPASYACAWGHEDGALIDLGPYEYVKKCVDDPGLNIEFHFDNGIPNLMTSASRKVTGFLTWPILAEEFEYLYEKLEDILACGANDGVRPYNGAFGVGTVSDFFTSNECLEVSTGTVWYKASATCTPGTIDQFLAHCERAGIIDNATAGTLGDPTTAGKVVAWGDEDMRRPWVTPTGDDGEECEALGPKVYCETINQFPKIIEEIEKVVWPKNTLAPIVLESRCHAPPGGGGGGGGPGMPAPPGPAGPPSGTTVPPGPEPPPVLTTCKPAIIPRCGPCCLEPPPYVDGLGYLQPFSQINALIDNLWIGLFCGYKRIDEMTTDPTTMECKGLCSATPPTAQINCLDHSGASWSVSGPDEDGLYALVITAAP